MCVIVNYIYVYDLWVFFPFLVILDYFTSCPTKLTSLTNLFTLLSLKFAEPYFRLILSYWWKISWGFEILGYFSVLPKGRVRLKFVLELLFHSCSTVFYCFVIYIAGWQIFIPQNRKETPSYHGNILSIKSEINATKYQWLNTFN